MPYYVVAVVYNNSYKKFRINLDVVMILYDKVMISKGGKLEVT